MNGTSNRRPLYAILRNKIVEPLETFNTGNSIKHEEFLRWAKDFENPENKVVKQERVGKFFVSTIFLGINHAFYGNGNDQWFETMVFNVNDEGIDCERYTNWDEAIAGHEKIVKGILEKDERN